MNIKQVNWGIIGCGNVTELKSGPAFNKVANSNLVAVMRRNATLAKDYAKRHGVGKWFDDAVDLIYDPEINAVYIATPPDSHAKYAIMAMQAGKPVYVEKPMARNYAECKEMLKVSEQTGMPLFVAYYRRTLPAFLKVKEIIEKEILGKILTVHIKLHKAASEKDIPFIEHHWHVKPEISGGGHFIDLASHQLDFLDFLFGPVIKVNGIAANIAGYYEAEDTVTASFLFGNGVIGSGNWSFVADKSSFEDYIEITGTSGKIKFPSFTHGDMFLTTKNGTEKLSFENPENISYNLVKQVVENIQGITECVSTGISASRTNAVIDEILKSYYSVNREKNNNHKGSCRSI